MIHVMKFSRRVGVMGGVLSGQSLGRRISQAMICQPATMPTI